MTPAGGMPDPATGPSRADHERGVARYSFDRIRSWLLRWLAETLGMPESAIDSSAPFDNFGLLSRDAVGLSGDLEDLLQCRLSPTIVWEYPSIDQLARYLADLSGGDPVAGSSPTTTTTAVTASRVGHVPIAVVGMACNFPGAPGLDAFWKLLIEGTDAIQEVPATRWDADALYHPNPGTPGKMNTRWGGFVNDIDQFDPAFFGISPREAASMDPQQRLLLEAAWRAFEDAGIAPNSIAGSRMGVFVGISSNDYAHVQLGGDSTPDAYAGTGNAHSIAANRLSYLFDLRGPSLAIDTACSSSLVALHVACKSIRDGECDSAIVGGVNVILSPNVTAIFSQARMMSPTGRCHTFDANADGYVRSEGCGVVLLKPLERALTDGDRVYAVVLGSAVNQDGRSNGLTAPNGLSQQAVIRDALADAQLSPECIGYVEAHGTGTPLGDPIEVESIKAVLSGGRDSDQVCYIGSVKTNVGHLEAAAGIAGFMKAALAAYHRAIPPHIQFRQLNPHISLKDTPFRIPIEVVSWRPPRSNGKSPVATQDRLFAGVSAFGFGGTNAHVVLGAPPVAAEKEHRSAPDHKARVLTLSAKSSDALRRTASELKEFLEVSPLALPDMCHTLNAGRQHLRHRAAVVVPPGEPVGVAPSVIEAFAAIAGGKAARNVETGEVPSSCESGVAFLFTGQGSQYTGMARQLYETQPVFRSVVDRCADYLHQKFEIPLMGVLFPEDASDDRIHQTLYTQPALYAIECALADLWKSWGVVPAAVMGHSVGEFAAAYTAGVFDLEAGLHLIAERARLMHSLPSGGSMAAILADPDVVYESLHGFEDRVSIAGLNGPSNTVISGYTDAVEAVMRRCTDRGAKAKALAVSNAFHSPLMDPILGEFEGVAATIEHRPPCIPLISNVTGSVFAPGEGPNAAYWRTHAREAVRFSGGVAEITRLCSVFVEIGPSPVLCGMAKRCVHQEGLLWLPSIDKGRDNWLSLAQTLAKLYTRGASLDWPAIEREFPGWKASLPGHPFNRQRYWGLPAEAALAATARPVTPQPPALPADAIYATAWEEEAASATAIEAIPNALWLTTERTSDGNWLVHTSQGEHRASTQAREYAITPGDPASWIPVLKQLDMTAASPTNIFLDLTYGDGVDVPSQRVLLAHALLVAVAQTVEESGVRSRSPLRVHYVTCGAQCIAPADSPDPPQAAVWGYARTVALEHASILGGVIDLDPSADLEGQYRWATHAAQVNSAWCAYRNGVRYVARLKRASDQLRLDTSSSPKFENVTVLVTGGLGDLGVATTRWFVDRGVRHVVLLGRRPLSAIPAQQQVQLQELESTGANVRYVSCDVASEASLREAANDVARLSWPPIKGIVHAAGILADHTVRNLTASDIINVMQPKADGLLALERVLDLTALDFLVVYSSAAAILGSPGQANYAAANACVDAEVVRLRRNGVRAVAVNWGPWADIGMAARMASHQASALRAVTPLMPAENLSVLGVALTSSFAQLCVVRANWERVAGASTSPAVTSLLKGLVQDVSQTPATSTPRSGTASARSVLDANTADRVPRIVEYLRSNLSRVLHIPAESIALDRSAFELGLDSIMIMEVLGDIGQDFGLTIYPREVFERPTLQELAEYLASELAAAPSTSAASTVAVAGLPASSAHAAAHVRPAKRIPGVALLLSSPRSGSTLLRVMLAGHSQLFCPPELHLLPFHTMKERADVLRATYLGEGLDRALMELTSDREAVARQIHQWEEASTTIDAVYAHLHDAVSPRLLIDKSPTYAESLETLQRAEALFEAPKYIFLARHPYAVIESFVRNRFDKLLGGTLSTTAGQLQKIDSYAVAEAVWASTNANTIDFLSEVAPDRVLVVKYEDLVSSPRAELARLCEFLGVPFEEAVLEPYQGTRMTDGVHATSIGIGDPGFTSHTSIEPDLGEAWKRVVLPRKLGGFARRVAVELGYDLPHEQVLTGTRVTLPGVAEHTSELQNLVRDALVPMRMHGTQDPLFLIHPAGGVVFPYFNLLPHLDPELPVYAIQEPCLKSHDEPPASVSEFAAKYIRLMKHIHPSGRYRVAGWSFGGAIAYEIARQLYEQGTPASSLVIMDTEAPLKGAHHSKLESGLMANLKLAWNRFKVAFSVAGYTGPYIRDGLWLVFSSKQKKHGDRIRLFDYVSWAWHDAMRHYFLKEAQVAQVVTQNARLMLIEQPTVRRTLHCLRRHIKALRAYKPAPFPGSVTLIKADQQSIMRRFYEDPDLGWRHLALNGVDVRQVPGNHVVLMSQGYIERLAHELTQALERGEGQTVAADEIHVSLSDSGHAGETAVNDFEEGRL